VYTDGRKTEEEHSQGGTTKVQAQWKDGRVEIVSKPETGFKTIEDLSITADRSQLRMTVTLEGGRSPVTLHLVYDAGKAGAPPPANPSAAPPAKPGTPAPSDLPPEL